MSTKKVVKSTKKLLILFYFSTLFCANFVKLIFSIINNYYLNLLDTIERLKKDSSYQAQNTSSILPKITSKFIINKAKTWSALRSFFWIPPTVRPARQQVLFGPLEPVVAVARVLDSRARDVTAFHVAEFNFRRHEFALGWFRAACCWMNEKKIQFELRVILLEL